MAVIHLSPYPMQPVMIVVIVVTVPHRCANLPASLKVDLASPADLDFRRHRKGPFP